METVQVDNYLPVGLPPPWVGPYLGESDTWLRFYDVNFQLVPLEGELQKQKAEELAERVAAQQEEIERLQAMLAGKVAPKNGLGNNQ